MKKTITKDEFKQEFKASNRNNQFSSYALEKLFDYFENLGEEIEFDLIAICCEYTEYSSLEELKRDYSIPKNEDVQEWLEDRTLVVCFEEDCILIQNF